MVVVPITPHLVFSCDQCRRVFGCHVAPAYAGVPRRWLRCVALTPSSLTASVVEPGVMLDSLFLMRTSWHYKTPIAKRCQSARRAFGSPAALQVTCHVKVRHAPARSGSWCCNVFSRTIRDTKTYMFFLSCQSASLSPYPKHPSRCLSLPETLPREVMHRFRFLIHHDSHWH